MLRYKNCFRFPTDFVTIMELNKTSTEAVYKLISCLTIRLIAHNLLILRMKSTNLGLLKSK